MSNGLGTYAFLPWLRRGAATQIPRVDGSGAAEPRATFAVTLGFNAGAQAATTNLALYGPGEVSTLDTRTVIRTWPRPGVLEAESNYFPLVEFDQADLPWRYTAARATTQDRLRPWIVLIVLRAEEIELYTAPSATQKLPIVKVKSAETLPKLAQSWAWAHVQVSGRESVTAAEAASLLATAPHTMLSRLIAPRRMDPKTKYRAFVVPAFERGRIAGLGQTPAENIDALAPAWADDGAMIDLPIYYEWEFQTAAEGDFEYLVRLLKARAMPPTVGTRPIDVSAPDPALPPAATTTTMRIEGGMLSPAAPVREWNATERAAFVTALSQLLNRPDDLLAAGGDTIVAPPLYGRWHAARRRIDFASGPRWFYDLNADPRDRVHAGLGTLVVQDQQEKLMASAWQQVDRIREINEKLRLAQLARESAIQIHKRHLQTATTESLLITAAPMFARVKGSPQTIRRMVADSPIGTGVFDAQFRRVARPRGPVGVRQNRAPDGTKNSTLLARMNDGTLQAAPPPAKPSTIFTPSAANTGLTPDWLNAQRLEWLERVPLFLWILVVILILIALLLFAGGALGGAAIAALVTIAVAVGAIALARWIERLRGRLKLRDGTITGGDVRNAPPRPGFTVVPDVGPGAPPPASPPSSPPAGTADSTDARNFRGAIADVFDEIRTPRRPGKVLTPIPIQRIAETIVTALDPRVTVSAAIIPRLRFEPGLGWAWTDPLEPVMAAPEFEQPMYEPLRDLSQDWLLPGLDQVPTNTISLLETNQRFVEGYMAGLNHEMARELLWREYPTDQRGTYFRQFWDVRGYVGASSPEALKDILPVTDWDNRDLSQNSARAPLPGGEPHLVLLIRGDLLRRYPTALVYAVKARKVGRLRELTDPPEERHPVFRGTLKPDVSFFGFELVESEVRGRTDDSPDQGWFFMIQEQPAEPRFGFDAATYPAGALTEWNDLNWAHFAANAAALQDIVYVDLTAALPNTGAVVAQPGEPAVVWHAGSGAQASHTAWITLQRPVRIAVHGSDMLP